MIFQIRIVAIRRGKEGVGVKTVWLLLINLTSACKFSLRGINYLRTDTAIVAKW